MKKLLLTALIASMVLGVSASANATIYPLPNDTSISNPVANVYPAGSLVTSIIGATFTGYNVSNVQKFSGTYSHWVLKNDTGLVFMYQFTNGTTAPTAELARLSTTDFAGWITSASYDANPSSYGSAASANTTPIVLDRSGNADNGSVIGLQWASPNKIHPGDISPLLWIQTNAQYYVGASSSLIDGGTANIFTYGPATPEPVTLSLIMGIGLMGFAGKVIKKRFAA